MRSYNVYRSFYSCTTLAVFLLMLVACLGNETTTESPPHVSIKSTESSPVSSASSEAVAPTEEPLPTVTLREPEAVAPIENPVVTPTQSAGTIRALATVAAQATNDAFYEVESARLFEAVRSTYAEIVYASYVDTYAAVEMMHNTLQALIAEPTPETHEAAKTAWIAARQLYGQTEAYRFYNGPIDDLHVLINAWPLDEARLDYVVAEGAQPANLISDFETYPVIDKALLLALSNPDSAENTITGYHAIEFLLWGQDLSDNGPGERPYTDYIGTGENNPAMRRGQVLLATSELLLDHHAELLSAWDPDNPNNYRSAFMRLEIDTALEKLLSGMAVLTYSELASRRIYVAYDNRDQEEEQSCFSDTTHLDLLANQQGIHNVFFGRYVRPDGRVVDGTSFADLLLSATLIGRNPEMQELNNAFLHALNQSDSELYSLSVPFDQAIINSETRPQVEQTVFALQDQGYALLELARDAFGLSICLDAVY